MHALVTGGAGFIGSALVERLLAEEYSVEVVDDLSTGSLANLAAARAEGSGRLRIHQADVRDPGLAELVSRRAPDVVFHLAGATAKADRSAVAQAHRDVVGTVNLLDALSVVGSAKIVTYAALRDQRDEVRGISARAVQEYLEAYRHRFGIEYTTLAFATVYGPRQTPRTSSSVVAVFAERVLAGEPVVLHGDGTPSRDLLFVDDAVDALVRAATGGHRQVIEVGTGAPVTIRALYDAVTAAAGLSDPPGPVTGERRHLEPGTVVADPGRAAEVLGWSWWTELADGLSATIAAVRATRT